MKNFLLVLIALILILMPLSGKIPAQGSLNDDLHQADPGRMALEIPGEIWDRVLGNIGYEGKTYGYTADEMAHFKGSACILRQVEMLFRDVLSIPRFTGRISNTMLANEGNFASSTFEAWKLLDAYSARQMSYALPTGWEADWIEEEADVDIAFNNLLEKFEDSGVLLPIESENIAEWENLPDEIKLLVVRVLLAAIETAPWLLEGFEPHFLEQFFETENLTFVRTDEWYEFASWPWQDDVSDPCPRESFEMLDRFDRRFFATGSNEFMRMTWGAIEEYKLAIEENPLNLSGFDYCEIDTPLGSVGIYGTDADTIDGDASRHAFIFNLGGDDIYNGMTAVPPQQLDHPFGIVIDLGGDDIYDSGDERASLACGLFGIGAIFDLGGDDRYSCDESGIGCAWYGTGLVVDYSGDDYYWSRIWGQGAAHAGVGMLIDLSGDDYYEALRESTAFGSTYGAGFLVDISGDDIYFADPEGNLDEVFEFRTVHFCQGTGFGRRADFYDGHSLGGGFGILVEGDGDDSYTGSVYSQGAGYWWSVGALEDHGGNDQYFNEQYSCGSAPHFAIGSCVDLEGDDRYNIGNEEGCERQIQGHARDGSIAVFIDGAGNDDYMLPNLAAGSSDLNCVTLFWDRMGDDNYTAERIPPRGNAHSFGGATTYSPFNTFRDTMASVGVYLDTGGFDTYSLILPEDEETVANLTPIEFADNHEWRHRVEHPNYGYGLDIDWYGGFVVVEEE